MLTPFLFLFVLVSSVQLSQSRTDILCVNQRREFRKICSLSILWTVYKQVVVDARCSPKVLGHFLSSAGQGRGSVIKYNGPWVEVRTGRDHSPVTITDKTKST